MANQFSDRAKVENYDENNFGFGLGASLSDEVMARSIQIVRHASKISSQAGYLWGVFDQNCKIEYDVISEGDPKKINNLIANLFGTNLTHGFLQGKMQFDLLIKSPGLRRTLGYILLDRLLCLAEATGAMRPPSPMQGQTSVNILNLDGLFAKIEDIVGVDLSPPDQDGGLFGIRLRGKFYSDRHFDGIYAAWRLRELTRQYEISSPSICEIGGGAGHLAFYAQRFGFHTYAIVDLPQAQLVQHMLLSSSLGLDRVSITGSVQNGIELIAAGSARAKQTKAWDILVNVDSLPEMPPEAANEYMQNLAEGQYLYSINQESGVMNGNHPQNVVRDMASRFGIPRLSRYPSWMRMGYVEELYRR